MPETSEVIYWDSSAVLSALFKDGNSRRAKAIAEQDALHLLTTLAYAEVIAVISRMKREHILTEVLQEVIDAGADEAVVLDAYGRIAETAAGSLLICSDGLWWTPDCQHQLPGITLQQLRRLFEERGHTVESRSVSLAELAKAQTVWVLNSLIGIMPVRSVDGVELSLPAAEEAARWRAELFAAGKGGV